MIGFGFGFTNFFALPAAISYDVDEGVSSLCLHVGPFFIELMWEAR